MWFCNRIFYFILLFFSFTGVPSLMIPWHRWQGKEEIVNVRKCRMLFSKLLDFLGLLFIFRYVEINICHSKCIYRCGTQGFFQAYRTPNIKSCKLNYMIKYQVKVRHSLWKILHCLFWVESMLKMQIRQIKAMEQTCHIHSIKLLSQSSFRCSCALFWKRTSK